MQEVQLDKNVKLLDCPGVVMLRSAGGNDASIALRNCKRIEKLDDLVGPGMEFISFSPYIMHLLSFHCQLVNLPVIFSFWTMQLRKFSSCVQPDCWYHCTRFPALIQLMTFSRRLLLLGVS